MKKTIKFKKKSIIIDGIEIKDELLKNYLSKKELKTIKKISDLSELKKYSENEIKKILNQMLKTKEFFKYSSSILININPGPNLIKEYLNLNEYLKKKKTN
jgi:myosin heavy subunit